MQFKDLILFWLNLMRKLTFKVILNMPFAHRLSNVLTLIFLSKLGKLKGICITIKLIG